ncbi:MAG: aminotransferase class V-fold PLP-dependent enzyme, partial [Chloroflexota bacterium]
MNSLSGTTQFDVAKIRKDFPIINTEVHPGVKVTYLDSAATSQKPVHVIEAMNEYYQASNANIHRGIHVLAETATAAYEGSRNKIAKFIRAQHSRE